MPTVDSVPTTLFILIATSILLSAGASCVQSFELIEAETFSGEESLTCCSSGTEFDTSTTCNLIPVEPVDDKLSLSYWFKMKSTSGFGPVQLLQLQVSGTDQDYIELTRANNDSQSKATVTTSNSGNFDGYFGAINPLRWEFLAVSIDFQSDQIYLANYDHSDDFREKVIVQSEVELKPKSAWTLNNATKLVFGKSWATSIQYKVHNLVIYPSFYSEERFFFFGVTSPKILFASHELFVLGSPPSPSYSTLLSSPDIFVGVDYDLLLTIALEMKFDVAASLPPGCPHHVIMSRRKAGSPGDILWQIGLKGRSFSISHRSASLSYGDISGDIYPEDGDAFHQLYFSFYSRDMHDGFYFNIRIDNQNEFDGLGATNISVSSNHYDQADDTLYLGDLLCGIPASFRRVTVYRGAQRNEQQCTTDCLLEVGRPSVNADSAICISKACPNQFFNAMSQDCEDCSTNCLECYGADEVACIQCKVGYIQNPPDWSCNKIECGDTCEICQDQTRCAVCQEGYSDIKTAGICDVVILTLTIQPPLPSAQENKTFLFALQTTGSIPLPSEGSFANYGIIAAAPLQTFIQHEIKNSVNNSATEHEFHVEFHLNDTHANSLVAIEFEAHNTTASNYLVVLDSSSSWNHTLAFCELECKVCLPTAQCSECNEGLIDSDEDGVCELQLGLSLTQPTGTKNYTFRFLLETLNSKDLPTTDPNSHYGIVVKAPLFGDLEYVFQNEVAKWNNYEFEIAFTPNSSHAGNSIVIEFEIESQAGQAYVVVNSTVLSATLELPPIYPSEEGTGARSIGKAGQILSTFVTVEVIAASLLDGSTSYNRFSALALLNLGEFIRYVNTAFPPHTETFFQVLSEDPLEYMDILLQKMFPHLYEPSISSVPNRFALYDDSTLFLENTGPTLVTLAGVLIVVAIVNLKLNQCGASLSRPCKRRWKSVNYTLQWNFVIGTVLGSYPELILAVCLQLRDYEMLNALATTSYSLCTLLSPTILFCPLLFYLALRKAFKSHIRLRSAGRLTRVDNSYFSERKSLQVLFRDMAVHGGSYMFYALICLLRVLLVVPALVFWVESSYSQLSLLLIGSIFMLGYHIAKNRLLEKKANWVMIVNEVHLLVSYLAGFGCVGGGDPRLNDAEKKTPDIMGWLLIGTLGSMILFNVILSLVDIGGLIKQRCKSSGSAVSGESPAGRNS